MKRISPANRNLILALIMGLGYLLALHPAWTGWRGHEWLGLALGAALIYHVWLHVKWVSAVTRQFVGRLTLRARINYLLAIALMMAFGLLVGSGVIISVRFDTPSRLALSIPTFATWVSLHLWASDVTVALVLLHLALHGRWLFQSARRLLLTARQIVPKPIPDPN